jgi:diguanylate cyclase (GGDEF)-like protein
MNISTGNKIGFLCFIVILSMWGYVVFHIIGIFDLQAIKDKKHHIYSLGIANELRQSSDDLTRMARNYVVTGDEIYKEYYFDIIAIRNGDSPRPKKYPPTYWHTSLTPERFTSDKLGVQVPLKTLMGNMGFTESELLLLQQSQARSDNLMTIEKQAFALMAGLYNDGKGTFTLKGEPERAFAVKLLFSPQYQQEKRAIMQPIQKFIEAVETRLIVEADEFNIKQKKHLWYVILLLVISTLMALIITFYVRNKIVMPIFSLVHDAQNIAEGNYQARSKVLVKNEIGSLSKNLNKMANHIEQDINKLRKMATTDELVGIANRRAFMKSLQLELERSHRYQVPLCLLMLDVDYFKVFNDTYGHSIGDDVLKLICNVSQLVLRENDLMGRIGGEEFAFILPATNIDFALIVAERIRAAVDNAFLIIDNKKVKVTVSMGATQLTKSDDVGLFLKRADKAMYKSKENGRNQISSV